MKRVKIIDDYELQELKEKKLLINKYDMDLKYAYELAPQWKAFFFDIIAEMVANEDVGFDMNKNLFNTFISNYNQMIESKKLKADIENYVDIVDYITFDEWEKMTGHFLGTIIDSNGYVLIEF